MIRAGFAYLRGQPVLLLGLALSFVLGSLGRNYQVTMAAMSDGQLDAGASGYGLLSTVFAVGTVVGALVAARRRSLGYRTLVVAGLFASGLQIVAGLAPGTWSFAAVILPIAAAAVVIDTTVGTRAQLDTDGAMRGRVLAALAVTGSVSAAVGAPLLGWLAEHAGPRQTLVLAGAARRSPRRRRGRPDLTAGDEPLRQRSPPAARGRDRTTRRSSLGCGHGHRGTATAHPSLAVAGAGRALPERGDRVPAGDRGALAAGGVLDPLAGQLPPRWSPGSSGSTPGCDGR